jgi:predicted transcriptional regulator
MEGNLLFDRLEYEVELLKRHIIVLKKVISGAPIGIRKIADETGIPEHKIRYSLRVLEQKGMITPTTHGANPTEKALQFQQQLDQKINIIMQKIQQIKKT